jgi:hypothetical protein
MTDDMKRVGQDLETICTELESLTERAMHAVEAVENDFQKTLLPADMIQRFFTLRRLLTRV